MKNLLHFVSFILSVALLPQLGIGQCPSDCDANSNNSIVGIRAGDSITDGGSNSFFGYEAGENTTSGGSNSFFGRSAGTMITTSSNNSFFGTSAGRNATSGSSNSFFGSSAGIGNTSGSDNSFFGRLAGSNTDIGAANAFFGSSAGRNNLNGGSNAFFGYLAGFHNMSGTFNTFFGRSAGSNNKTGSNNAFFGRSAGTNLLGSRNVCIGSRAGPEPPDSNNSDRLYIDVETSSDPLIYGEFDNDFVRVNGTFEVTTGLLNPSSKELKTDFHAVDHKAVLQKLAALDIMKWRYKSQPGAVHIGPVAEDFHSSFGYGSDTQIFTIDADGIAMAAIKALHELNLQQQQKLNQLESEIAELKSLLTKYVGTAEKPPD